MCMHTHGHDACTHLHTTHTRACICMHTHENHTCTHTHARTRMHAHACTHTHARTRMHAHACTHTHAQPCSNARCVLCCNSCCVYARMQMHPVHSLHLAV